jgi:hypothetical protein
VPIARRFLETVYDYDREVVMYKNRTVLGGFGSPIAPPGKPSRSDFSQPTTRPTPNRVGRFFAKRLRLENAPGERSQHAALAWVSK